jgi:hypothetical protein
VKLVLLEEAQQQFEAEDAWWRENRDAKDLFIEEFSVVLNRISSTPEVGQPYRRTRDKLIQRVLMKKTRCHVYYFHAQERGVVEVHSCGAHARSAVQNCNLSPRWRKRRRAPPCRGLRPRSCSAAVVDHAF